MIFSKKRLIIIGVALVVVILAIVAIALANQPNNIPVESKVPEGETVNPSDMNSGGGSSSSGNNGSSSNGNGGSSSNNGNGTSSNGGSTAAKPTTAELSEVIQRSASYLTDAAGQPTFGIVKTASPLAGWYVVSISIPQGQPMKVILLQTNDPNNPLTVVAGPGTAFPADVVSLPEVVRKATL